MTDIHERKIYRFKKIPAALNFIFSLFFIVAFFFLVPRAIDSILNFDGIGSMVPFLFSLLLFWLGVFEFGYASLLYFPNGVALELYDDYLKICSIKGLQYIPREAVKGCKKVAHRFNGGPGGGVVEISVDGSFKVKGPYGGKINPYFFGASICGETEQSMLKIIRVWRKSGLAGQINKGQAN